MQVDRDRFYALNLDLTLTLTLALALANPVVSPITPSSPTLTATVIMAALRVQLQSEFCAVFEPQATGRVYTLHR